MVYRSTQLPQLPDGTYVGTLWHTRTKWQQTLSAAILVTLTSMEKPWKLNLSWVNAITDEKTWDN